MLASPDLLAPNLSLSDPEVWAAIRQENQRQEDHVELIASENYVSRAVLTAQGSQLTNKYAEGYPGKRYYGGCEYVDIAEHHRHRAREETVRRAVGERTAAFGLAGEPGGVLPRRSSRATRSSACRWRTAGHLTHGSPGESVRQAATGVVSYGLDRKRSRSTTTRPRRSRWRRSRSSSSPAPRRIRWRSTGSAFAPIADKCGALLMADIAHYAGLIAAGLYPSRSASRTSSPPPTHKTLRGPRGGMIFGKLDAGESRSIRRSFPGCRAGR